MKRRRFLQSSAAVVLTSSFASRVLAATSPVPVVVVITDISAQTSVGSLSRAGTMFQNLGIPLTFSISLPKPEEGDTAISQIIGELVQRTGSANIALAVPDLQKLSPYFQARAVFDARTQLFRLAGAAARQLTLQTVNCDEVKHPKALAGLRASGIRNVLVKTAENRQVKTEAWPNGVVRFAGGHALELSASTTMVDDIAPSETQRIYYISANALEHLSEQKLEAWSQSFAKNLFEMELSGKLSVMDVSELQLRDSFNYKRSITILIDSPSDADELQRQNALAFQDGLRAVGIASALKPSATKLWVGKEAGSTVLVPFEADCQRGKPSRLTVKSPLPEGFGVHFVSDQSSERGVDGCALLRVPLTMLSHPASAESLSQKLKGVSDGVLLVSAKQIATPAARRMLISVFLALLDDGITRFDDVMDIAANLFPVGFIERRHNFTARARANAQLAQPAILDRKARENLLVDARRAWSFFQKYTQSATGLCPATVDTRSNVETHQAVTMWDVGSNILALVAAAQIKLIDQAELKRRMEQILPNITGRRTQGRRLPQGWIRADRFHWGNADFDGCDAGRLLAALDHLRRNFGMEARLEKLVSGWDFMDVIEEGQIYSVKDRKLVSTFHSHCAHYAAIAFRRWGYGVSSPYETFDQHQSADGEVALLEAAANIGPIGAEPLLLEALELGMSPESEYLASVLDFAQQEEFSETGRLICASETPIDRSPWFVYQGLQLGTGPRDWRLDTVGHEPQYQTKEAADKYLAFSTKAAFLWAAYKPSEHSDKLLSFARQNAVNRVGFASSVNLKFQRTTRGYTDLNSNAIILQAVAHKLARL